MLAKKFGFPAGKFTYADYRWAVSTVMTRQNKVPIFGPEGPAAGPPTWALALVPFWDMINHERGKMTTGHDTDSKRLVCHAGRQFRAGEQVRSSKPSLRALAGLLVVSSRPFVAFGPRSKLQVCSQATTSSHLLS